MASDPLQDVPNLAVRALELGGSTPDPVWAEEVRRLAAEPTFADDHVLLAIDALDSTVWNAEEGALGAARIFAAAGRAHDAFDRLRSGGRLLETALRFDRAAAMYAAAAEVDELDDQAVDDALMLQARALAATRRADDVVAAIWRRLEQRAVARGDDDARARALYHRYWCDGDDDAGPQLLAEAAACGTGGWAARSRAMQLTCDGEYDAAIVENRRALGIARRLGDVQLESIALEGIGHAFGFMGRVAEHDELLRQSVAINEQHGDVTGALFGRFNLTENRCLDLDPRAALEECALLRRLIPADEHGRWSGFADALESRIRKLLGEVDRAVELAKLAAVSFAEDGPGSVGGIMPLICIESMLEGGDLAGAAPLLAKLQANTGRTGVGAMALQGALMAARLASIDEGTSAAATLEAAGTALDGSDTWVTSDGGWWLCWRAVLEDDAATTEQLAAVIDVDDVGDPLAKLLVRGIHGARALLVDDDDRPLRIVRRAFAGGGMRLDELRISAMLASHAATRGDRDARTGLAHVQAAFDAMGAVVDADFVGERVAQLGPATVAVLAGQPLLDGVPDRLVERLGAVALPLKLDAGSEALLGGSTTILVAEGMVRVSQADGEGPLLAVLGPGAVYVAPASGPELRSFAKANARGWSVAAGAFDAWLETLEPAVRSIVRRRVASHGGVISRVTDTRPSVESRMCALLGRLDALFGTAGTEPGTRELSTTLRQGELADLISASRKSTTLQLSKLRAEGLLATRLGRVVLLAPGELASRVEAAP